MVLKRCACSSFRLAQFDIVITTYDLVKNELSEKKLLNAVNAGSECDSESDGGAKKASGEKRVVSFMHAEVLTPKLTF